MHLAYRCCCSFYPLPPPTCHHPVAPCPPTPGLPERKTSKRETKYVLVRFLPHPRRITHLLLPFLSFQGSEKLTKQPTVGAFRRLGRPHGRLLLLHLLKHQGTLSSLLSAFTCSTATLRHQLTVLYNTRGADLSPDEDVTAFMTLWRAHAGAAS